MGRNDPKGELWESARLCVKGAYNANLADVPRAGDPKPLLRFLDHHMSLSPEQRRGVGTWPFYYVFYALSSASDEETDRGLAEYDFTSPIFINTVIESLENKDSEALRESAMLILAKLDSHLFTGTNETFKDEEKALRFVTAWSTVAPEFLKNPGSSAGRAVIKVLLATAHLPCLREHVPKERWILIQHFPHIMLSNPPALQRCLNDTTIVPFLKPIADPQTPFLWLTVLWLMYHNLSQDVRKQLEEETREIAAGSCFYNLDSYVDALDTYTGNLDRRIGALDPLDHAASELQAKRQRIVDARRCLIGIKMNTKRNRGF